MIRLAPLLAAALLTACSGGTETAANNSAAAEPANSTFATMTRIGWSELFASNEAAVKALNGNGFRLGAYEPHGDSYHASGAAISLSNTEAAKPNTMSATLDGARDTVSRIAFTADLADQPFANEAKDRFVESLKLTLEKFGASGIDAIRQPILDEKPAQGQVSGADWKVARTAGKGDVRTITVTFTPAATNAAVSQPRKQ